MKTIGDVLKLFKKTLSLNGSSPSLIIEEERCGKGDGRAERATKRGHP